MAAKPASPASRQRTGSTVDGDVRRQQIVAAAARLFDSDGYHQTNIAAIAAAVGIAKPTIYHYFPSKHDILFSIHSEFMSTLLAKQAARARLSLSNSEALREVMVDILEIIQVKPGHVRTFFEHHRELHGDQRTETVLQRDLYYQSVHDIIVRGIEEGEFIAVNADSATLGLFGMCNWAYQWYRPDGLLSPREIAHQLCQLLLGGIAVEREPVVRLWARRPSADGA